MTTTNRPPTNFRACPMAPDVVQHALDGESGMPSDELRDHLEVCESCRSLLDDVNKTSGALSALSSGAPCRDLLPDVLERIPEHAWRDAPLSWRMPRQHLWRAAAVLLILLGIGWTVLSRIPRPEAQLATTVSGAAESDGLQWLLTQQDTAGGWDAQSLGGQSQYDLALNGLAMLAVAGAEGGPSVLGDALGRAGERLLRGQLESGQFGPEIEGTMYNHGIATLALLEVHQLTGEDSWREPISQALSFICRRQAPTGGWGYSPDPQVVPNTSVTAWQVQALLRARELGWGDYTGPLRRAVAWMSGTVGPRGHFGYQHVSDPQGDPETLTMMGAFCLLSAAQNEIPVTDALSARVRQGVKKLSAENPNDYYGTFFYSAALQASDAEAFGQALARVRESLVEQQQQEGEHRGRWSPGDQWSKAGGGLYSTSMALLTLRQPAG